MFESEDGIEWVLDSRLNARLRGPLEVGQCTYLTHSSSSDLDSSPEQVRRLNEPTASGRLFILKRHEKI